MDAKVLPSTSLSLSILMHVCVCVCLSIYLSIDRSMDLIYLSIYLSTHLPIYLSTYLPTYLSTYLPTYLPIYLSIYLYDIWYIHLPKSAVQKSVFVIIFIFHVFHWGTLAVILRGQGKPWNECVLKFSSLSTEFWIWNAPCEWKITYQTPAVLTRNLVCKLPLGQVFRFMVFLIFIRGTLNHDLVRLHKVVLDRVPQVMCWRFGDVWGP